MASSDHDVGVGGKFRKRPFRRAPTTPYDRPQPATRRGNPNPNPNSIGSNDGWISKIVNPASRIIAGSAAKIFSSVFQKRLTAPPARSPPEENLLSACGAPETMQKLSDKAPEQGVHIVQNAANLCDTDITQQKALSGTDGFFELEQRLKQKVFTRAEVDRLTDLLRSRTVEPSTSKPAVDFQHEEKVIVRDQVQHNKQSIIEPSTSSHPVVRSEQKEMEHEDGMKSSSLHGNIIDLAANLQVPEEEAVTPTEIAKEYMGSRPSKVSPSSLNLRSRILQEDSPSVKKPSTDLLASTPSVRFSEISKHTVNGYITPKARGRSALYRMSRSPYFKVHQTTNTMGGSAARDGLSSSSRSSSLVPPRFLLSSGKQVLKRENSVLDNDSETFGTVRRVRQKSDLMSPSERYAPPPGVAPVPPQSTEMARKIFQELDKLVHSSREKLSETKGSGNLDASSDSPPPSLRNSISLEQGRTRDNTPSDKAVSAMIPLRRESVSPMSVPEESSELGATKYNVESASRVPIIGNDKLLGKSSAYPSEKTTPASSSMLEGQADGKTFDRTAPVEVSQSSPTPRTQPPFTDRSVTNKEISASASASKWFPEELSTATAISRSASLKAGASVNTTVGVMESSASDKGSKTQNADDLCTSFGNGYSSNTSTIPCSSTPSVSTPVNGVLTLRASAQSSSPSSTFAQNNFSNSSSHFGGTAGSTFGAQPQSGSGPTSFQCGSFSSGPTFGLNASSSLESASKPFGSHATFSSSSASIPSFAATASTSLFNSNSQPSLPSNLASTSLQSTGFPFGTASFTTGNTSASPMQGAGFNSGSPGNDRMNVEDSMVDDVNGAAAPSVPIFGQTANSLPTPTLQFGVPAAPSGPPTFQFGNNQSSSVPQNTSVFQFGSNQSSTAPQNPSPFQTPTSFEFSAGGSFSLGSGAGDKPGFSLGSGAGDKSGRRIIRVKRDKRKK
ncbi:nuclear pore complex protein NUP1-like isoform X2 [Asparagus officinalis]|uniref:nuclear pore complex protein NUP1-like isoform X2 n=1 Tax=Asparagus officinalis TaxID=4686 RepID=UPI00098E0A20|nr:nuclear pore complex protein NUP1-like isoform X2 [Asparagus officinalis]